ncbi:MAG TPA: outer membrane beta-barrel protein [Verrucomicrobiae bacterium]|jgi:opacity protein-like surface antigen|nr:outer membrane beta-barrel protein [Verrucomicrobiae bacterium]
MKKHSPRVSPKNVVLMLASVSTLFIGTVTVRAWDTGFYLGADAGVNIASELIDYDLFNVAQDTTKFNAGPRIDLYTGYAFRLCDHLSLAPELETGILYNSFKGSDGNLKQVPVLVNLVLDTPITDKLNAYAGIGLGIAYFDVSVPGDSPKADMATQAGALAWHVKAGIQYKLGRGDLGLSYQYLETGTFSYNNVHNNSILASYTIHF